MNSFQHWIWPVTPAILIGLLAFAARAWILERLKNNLKHEYDSALEGIRQAHATDLDAVKGHLAHQDTVIADAHKSLMNAVAPFRERRIEGVMALWSAFLSVDGRIPVQLIVFDLLTNQEYRNCIDAGIIKLVSMEQIKNITVPEDPSIESVRPIVGEYLWNMYEGYTAVLARIALVYQNDFHAGLKQPWFDDSIINDLVYSLLTDDERQHFNQQKTSKLAAFRTMFHRKFALAIAASAAGKPQPEACLTKATEIANALAAVQEQRMREAIASKELPRGEASMSSKTVS